MKRIVRKSTAAKSEELSVRLRQRELKSTQRKSRQLLKQADLNSASIDEALKLSCTQSGDSSDSGGSIGQEDDYWYDTSNIELSNTISPVLPVPTAQQDPETWSNSNQFFPEGCVVSPVIPSVNSTEVAPSQILEPVLSESEVDPPILSAQMVIMDELTVKRKVKDLKNGAEDVEMSIERFNPETVTILDKDDYKTELNSIFTQFRGFQVKVNTFKESLDVSKDFHSAASDNVTTVFQNLKAMVLSNEKAVKQQMVKLVNERGSASSERETEADQEKLKLKVSNAKSKFKSLKDEVSKITDIKGMSDNEVREHVVTSREWKKDLKSYQDLREKLDVEMVSVTVEDELKESYVQAYDDMVKVVTDTMTELLSTDKDLGLYSLADTKAKSSVQYPDCFGGSLGENVFKFIKEFREAIISDHVRKADEVKTLIKYLKGDAKSSIGEHHKTLDGALLHLEDMYGCPRLIVEKYTKEYEKSFGNIRNWGKHGSKERVNAINKTVDFIRNLEDLAANHPGHLHGEIYSKQTLLLLTKGMPHEYTKRLNESCGHKDPYVDWFATIFDILEDCKSTNLSALSTGIGALSRVAKEENPSGSRANQLSHNGHDCVKSSMCKDKWDLLGCIHLYKVTQVSDRETFLRERRGCFRCGRSPFSIKGGKHICSWKNGKMSARCTGKHTSGGRCFKAAAMCAEHTDNGTDVLLDWLKTHHVKFSVNMMLLSHEINTHDSYYDNLKSKVNKQGQAVAKCRSSVQNREALQSGKAACMMDDEQIYEFFSEDMRKMQSSAKVSRIPSGEAIFIFCVVAGLNGPVMAFIDCGANCFLAKEGVPENEFISVKLSNGPIPLSVAGGSTAYASAEYASLLPLANGNFQAVRGLTLKHVTGNMPELHLTQAFEQIKQQCSSNKRIQNIHVPSVIGGEVQIILGIRYQSIYPQILHTFPNGLTVFESKLQPAEPGALACLGGPISSFESLCGTFGASSTLSYMANLIQNTSQHLSIDLFPSDSYGFDGNGTVQSSEMSCASCGSFLIQSELERFMRIQDAGLDINFKCPACRNCKTCLRGAGKELLTMKEEYQQQIIEESVRIDDNIGQAVARLAFISDPSEGLTDNEYIAVKRLRNVCRKYAHDPAVREMISKGFDKLIQRGHILLYDNLSEHDKELVDDGPGYTIPWDVNFKQESVSTPARPTFDASSKTSGGCSLNDNLARGRTDLVNLFAMVLGWLIGPVALHGDISKFYNSVLLEKTDWKYQKVVWHSDLDPNSPLIKGVVRTLIYGVRCVSAQTEHVKNLLQERVRKYGTGPHTVEVANFIQKFYADDGATSVATIEDAHALIKETDAALASIKMNVKGWSLSFHEPSKEVSEDGVSVNFAGMMWFTSIDSYRLKIQPLHFGKKRRGRYPDDLQIHNSGSIADFVPEILTRRMCSSVSARIYDVPGLLAPLTLKLKYDLRKLIHSDPGWNTPCSAELRQLWIQNFHFIEELRDVLYVRCKIPTDALRCTVRLWFLCDGSPDGGMIITAYSGCERVGGSWSSQLLCAKNLLTPQGWTTPQTELHALSSLANLASVVESSLSSWIEVMYYGSDSSISISWVAYERVRLHVFHRLRVGNIRNKVQLENIYHVSGKENIADTGTRPDLLKPEHILPGSEWLTGKSWMTEPVEKAIQSDVIKSLRDIKLDDEAKKQFKEGVMMDSSLNTVSSLKEIMPNKVVEREVFSNYIYPPLKRQFPSLVRIVAYIHLAVLKFKTKMVRARLSRNVPVSDGSTLESLKLPAPKFKVFSVLSNSSENQWSLCSLFNIDGVCVSTNSSSYKHIRLSDEILSLSLDYLYRKAGAEVLHFNDGKYVSKIGEVHGGIVYCKSRIEEGQQIKVVGGLENTIDLKTFTGVNFKVPIIDRYSPLALSIASYLHYQVIRHQGAETLHRMSLQYARILGGRELFKLLRKECIYCQKLLLRYVRQIMGPLSDHQLSVSPIFYYTFADIWGPLRAYVPGYQRSTRAGSKNHDVYILVFGCASTGTVNCQVMEGGKSAACVTDALNRFFNETCVPKIFHIDQDSALMKALSDGQIDILSNSGIIAQERGIIFQTCAPQGHNAHGRIERRIRMLQEAFERSEMKMFRLHSLGWQTVAKKIEHDVNAIPLGYLTHREDCAPLLRVLSPNFLKLNAGADRSPNTLFTMPENSSDMTKRVEDAYRTFFRIWNEDYVPLVANRQKWFFPEDNLNENDVVYFKLKDSPLSARWLLGKVEGLTYSKDKKIRKVDIGYKFDSEQGVREFRVVQRPVREVVKLWNLEETTLFDDIREVRAASKAIIHGDVAMVPSFCQMLGLSVAPDFSSSIGQGFSSSNDEKNAVVPHYSVGHVCNPIESSDIGYNAAAIIVGTHATYGDDAILNFSHVCNDSKMEDDFLDIDMDEEFFMIRDQNDYDKNDKYDDNDILLLL